MSYAEDFDSRPGHSFAPSKEEIWKIDDYKQITEMLSYATDKEISIKTQLEFFVDDEEVRGRRVQALIFWRIALKNLKNRQTNLKNKSSLVEG